jgi:LPXTG-motif cell wall-anchored protein
VLTARRLLSAVAAAATVLTVLPAPAQAAAPAPLTLTVQSMSAAPEGHRGAMFLHAGPGAPAVLTDARIVLDATGIADFATAFLPQYAPATGKITPQPDCTVAGAITTCPVEVFAATNGTWLVPHLVTASKPGAKLGRQGTLTVTLTAKEIKPLVATSTVTVAESADLGAGPERAVETVKPGDTVPAQIEVTSSGRTAVKGAALQLLIDNNTLSPAAHYRNCEYGTKGGIFCTFDDVLKPGTTYRIAEPIYQVAPKTPAGHQTIYTEVWFTADDRADQGDEWYKGDSVTRGTGDELHLVAEPAGSGGAPVKNAAELRADAKTTDVDFADDLVFGYVLTPGKPRPSTSASHPATAGHGNGTGGGGLPITGANTTLAAGAGGLLLLVGAALFLFTRRRRTSFTA